VTKAILSGAIALSLAAAAHAQSVETSPESTLIRRSRWTWSGWGGTGYGGFTTGYSGYGYGYGYGYYGGTVGVDYYGYGAGSLYGGAGYYRSYGFRRPIASADAAGPGVRSGPVADRLAEFTSAREIEAGRACLKSGDYRGAVDQFRSAVAAHTENPVAQAWFAVVLAITGDVKNADKALRAAAAAGFPLDRVTLADAFRDEKERVRVIVALAKASGDGSLAVAFALSQAGEAVPLKKLSEKDPVAKQLLPKP
jgi:hypothetical protein